jgi:predicted alpha/beta superfamily hydrolase
MSERVFETGGLEATVIMPESSLAEARLAESSLAEACLEDDAPGLPEVCLVDDADSAREVSALLERPCVLVSVPAPDWERDLSPWPAPRAFAGSEDFTGGADAFLTRLEDCLRGAEACCGLRPTVRAIAGYSLAGLFAVYAVYKSRLFSRAASVSGSMWFDGFTEYMASHAPARVPERMYFSLGSREARVKDPRLAAVETATARAAEIMSAAGAATVFEHNAGGHFAPAAPRLAKGINHLLYPDRKRR